MQKKENTLNYIGLYGDEQGKYSSEYLFLELITTRSQAFNWIIKPHVHSHLFQVFFVSKGQLEFINGQKKSTILAPCILVIPPTFVHGLSYSPDVEGYILSVSDGILSDIFQSSITYAASCQRIYIVDKFKIESTYESIIDSIKILEKELFSEQIERGIMLKAQLSSLFIHLFRLSDMEAEKYPQNSRRQYYNKFIQLIKSTNYTNRITEYAEELHISPVHLNRICQAISGKSASEIITQNAMIEAQKYLLHTSYSISEIAYKLNFEYPNYFARKFKKHTGKSPQEFRRIDRN